ncbi:uncharacterized protein LOC100870163 isoform X2 [Apis florea]|uniref:uncharacterized protein LOC100870163 isoform X2 n=1 Tax=Apis florea TaxID=7463 RepID=UPI000252C41D|nr:uncharacterized protein LOC100870163 isoform X2 [Apis florea]
MKAIKVIGFLLFITSIGALAKTQTGVSSGQSVSSTVAPKGKGSSSNPIVSLLTCVLENVGDLLGISLTGLLGDLGQLIGPDGSLNLSGLISDLVSILNIPLDEIFNALRTGNLSQLTQELQPLVNSLLNLPIVGSLLSLLANVLQVPVSLIVAVLGLVLQIVKSLLDALLGGQIKCDK